MDKEDYIKYVLNKDSGLQNTNTIDGIKYSLQYLPSNFMVLTENQDITVDSLATKEQQYAELEYFKLTIEEEKTEKKSRFSFLHSPSEYNKLLQYTNTELNNKIELNTNKEVLPCVMSYVETGYKVAPKIILLLAFKKPSYKSEYKVSYRDGIFGNGIINFLVEEKDLEKLRIIKII
ncbi:MAG: hypothetical protein ACT4ON_12580 [Bacteroidota bacterium]